jgi:hypothetical protein
VDGIHDLAKCGHGSLVVRGCELFYVTDRIRLGGVQEEGA